MDLQEPVFIKNPLEMLDLSEEERVVQASKDKGGGVITNRIQEMVPLCVRQQKGGDLSKRHELLLLTATVK